MELNKTIKTSFVSVSLAALSAFLVSSSAFKAVAQAAVPVSEVPRGILAPIGGGATQVEETGAIKAGQREIFAELFNLFQAQRQNSASLGSKICLVSYSSTTTEQLETEFMPMKALLSSAGISVKDIEELSFASRDRSNERSAVSEFRRNCGFIFLPGGNQTTEISLWSGTLFQEALTAVYFAGGVISGKSAGAAVLGKWVFTPPDERDAVVSSFLGEEPIANSEVRDQPLIQSGSRFPEILFETHTGDRERSARGAVFLGYLNSRLSKENRQRIMHPLVVAVDSDTAAVIQYAQGSDLWKLSVLGSRAVEIQSIDSNTRFSSSSRGRIEVSNLRSDLLAPDDIAWLNQAGEVVSISEKNSSGRVKLRTNANAEGAVAQNFGDCLSPWAGQVIGGNELAEREARSSFWFKAVASESTGPRSVPAAKELVSIEDAEYAYLTGEVKVIQNMAPHFKHQHSGAAATAGQTPAGCGLWLTRAFNADFGHPENRLNLLRYGLAKNLANVALSLSDQTFVQILGRGELAVTTDSELSLFVLDTSLAQGKRVSKVVYSELGAKAPIQIGRYLSGRLHLIGPGGKVKFSESSSNVQFRSTNACAAFEESALETTLHAEMRTSFDF